MATTPITADNPSGTHQAMEALEQRIEALEAKNAFQEDLIEQLNQEITIHQAAIAEMKEHLHLVAQRVKDMAPSNVMKAEDEPPPPHY
ncbi:SlyX family protein [Thalassotalea euphylliae]|nr:SlyX family protein [Thalassotalea euphylliae]